MDRCSTLVVLAVFAVGLSMVSSECRLKESSSDNPYLVRIFECREINLQWPLTNASRCLKNNTVAHGSLISADVVLTTCTWYKLSEVGEITFRVYNTDENCVQERSSSKYIAHKDCDNAELHSENLLRNDFVLWFMDEPFDVDVKAILWRGQWGGISPPKLDDMDFVMDGIRTLLVVVTICVVGFGLVSSECRLTESSSDNPYLVRIFKCERVDPEWPLTNTSRCTQNITVAHGSLISAGLVLTACTWIEIFDVSPNMFRAYNTDANCVQERSSSKYIAHKDCEHVELTFNYFMENDFAFWVMDKPFDVDVKAILWRGQWGGISPPKLDDMKSIIKNMSLNKPACSAALFSNSSAVDGVLESDASVEFIPWTWECLAMLEKVFPIDDDPMEKPLRRIGDYRFSCGRDKGVGDFTVGPPDEIGLDWRSGAAVVCVVDGKKVPIGMFSRIVAPAPWAETKSFRVTVGFHWSFYDFIYDTVGIQPETYPESDCKLSGENFYPYLLRIVKKEGGFHPSITVGHGALVRVNMVLSSCTPYRKLPKDLTDDKNWMFIGYNPKESCTQRRQPNKIYMHEDCQHYGEDQIILNDFAIWTPSKPFELDIRVHYPNLWQGPNMPPIKDVVGSILELSEDDFLLTVSRRLAIGIFQEPELVTGERQVNAEVEFVPWEECLPQLDRFVNNDDDVKKEYVMDKSLYPVFCGYDYFNSVGPKTNKTKADWFSGAIVMYSYLWVYESGEEPATISIPLGILSRVVVGQSEPDMKNIRVVAGFSKGFYKFIESTEDEIARSTPRSSQPPSTSSAALGFLFLAVSTTAMLF